MTELPHLDLWYRGYPAVGTWMQWKIPLSDLTADGVKTNKVQKVTIGVGDRNSPKAGGTGMLFIDDLGFGRPAQ